MYQIKLPQHVVKKLLAQNPKTESKGGFQKLGIKLQRQVDATTGVLQIDSADLEKIERYRKQYGQGGWQDLLDEIAKQTKAGS